MIYAFHWVAVRVCVGVLADVVVVVVGVILAVLYCLFGYSFPKLTSERAKNPYIQSASPWLHSHKYTYKVKPDQKKKKQLKLFVVLPKAGTTHERNVRPFVHPFVLLMKRRMTKNAENSFVGSSKKKKKEKKKQIVSFPNGRRCPSPWIIKDWWVQRYLIDPINVKMRQSARRRRASSESTIRPSREAHVSVVWNELLSVFFEIWIRTILVKNYTISQVSFTCKNVRNQIRSFQRMKSHRFLLSQNV